MPRLKHSHPKYRLNKTTGRAVVTLGGRDHYLGKHDTPESRAEYDRVIAEWLSSGRQSRPTTPPDSISVAEVLLAYLRFAKSYYVKNGKPTNELAAMRLVIQDARRLYGDTPAQAFGPLALKAVRNIWIEKGQARPTVNKNARRLTRIFRWAVAEELLPGGVIQSLTAVPA